jgi:putrescine importer
MSSTGTASQENPPKLKRALGLWDLVFYGIVLIQPIAAVGPFGIAQQKSGGHMVATILIAMFAMMLTAVSYGRMASVYPSAGSAYTYVSRGLQVHLGFLAGWAMILDYLVIPIISTMYAALTLARIVPGIPSWVWVIVLCVLTTLLNLRGIRTTAMSNMVLLAGMSIVIVIFFIAAVEYLYGQGGATALFSMQPIYNPSTFHLRAVLTTTSFAALTYIGFDGVTTLAEEVKNPRRNVLLATVLVCFLTGVFSTAQIYLAALVWPDYNAFPNIETAFLDVCRRAGGEGLFRAMDATLFVACVGTALAAQAGAARLLYGMGRNNVLPKTFFGRLDKNNEPMLNICLIGAATIAGSLLLDYERAAEIINFGAFLAFIGVNAAAIKTFYFGRSVDDRSFIRDCLVPLAGLVFCCVIWFKLPKPAMIVGACWVGAGLIYQAIVTRGFRREPASLDFISNV